MITFKQKGDFKNLNSFLERIKEVCKFGKLDRYGEMGVRALQSATPVDTGVTASSWYYKIEHTDKGASISFYNSNVNEGVPIAIILQTGHGTGNGGYVQGVDYINPALKPIFDKITEEAWKEITR
jgi:hypothetical protein